VFAAKGASFLEISSLKLTIAYYIKMLCFYFGGVSFFFKNQSPAVLACIPGAAGGFLLPAVENFGRAERLCCVCRNFPPPGGPPSTCSHRIRGAGAPWVKSHLRKKINRPS
jgi:hypothetical protein